MRNHDSSLRVKEDRKLDVWRVDKGRKGECPRCMFRPTSFSNGETLMATSSLKTMAVIADVAYPNGRLMLQAPRLVKLAFVLALRAVATYTWLTSSLACRFLFTLTFSPHRTPFSGSPQDVKIWFSTQGDPA